MSIREAKGRWYLCAGHFWHLGWSIIDVTDAAAPRVARFILGPDNTFTLQMTLSGDTMVTALEKIFATFGGKPRAHFSEGVLIWDISDPADSRQLGHWRTDGTGTHRPTATSIRVAAGAGRTTSTITSHPDVEKQGALFYIAHFNAGLRVFDVSNTRLPVEVGYFLPPEPRRRYGPMPEGALVLQSEDVVVDRRGFIYVSDKNQGIWILRYAGARSNP